MANITITLTEAEASNLAFVTEQLLYDRKQMQGKKNFMESHVTHLDNSDIAAIARINELLADAL